MARGYKPPLTEVRRLPRDKTWWYINDIDTYNNDNRRLVRIKSPIQISVLERNNNMTKLNKIPTHTIKSNGYTFIYTPSMHCMDVNSPNGRLDIIHNLHGERWITVANKILASS